MRSVSFEYYRERIRGVFAARAIAAAPAADPPDGRPTPQECISLALHALETHGPTCGPLETADEWLGHLDCSWHEYGVALENLSLGITPPTSGNFNNDYYGECTGGASRAEVWGMLHPADPVVAAVGLGRASLDDGAVALGLAGGGALVGAARTPGGVEGIATVFACKAAAKKGETLAAFPVEIRAVAHLGSFLHVVAADGVVIRRYAASTSTQEEQGQCED